jgi:hypothetical protein
VREQLLWRTTCTAIEERLLRHVGADGQWTMPALNDEERR